MRKQVPRSESVGTLARGLDILGLFARGTPELSQKEISDALGLPLPTVHRITGVLAERGYLERDPRSRRLRLGLEISRLLPPLLRGLRLPDIARAHAAALAAETGETVNVAILQGAEVVYLVSEAGGRLLTSHNPVGTRLPAHCTALGKCLLAQLDDERARECAGQEPYPARTPRTLTTWTALQAALDHVRETGVAVSEEEFEVGLVSIAVALPGAALNVALPAARATPEFRADLIARLHESARAIEAAAGAGDALAAV